MLCCSAVAWFALRASSAQSPKEYALADLGPTLSIEGMNDHGLVVGYRFGSPGVLVPLASRNGELSVLHHARAARRSRL